MSRYDFPYRSLIALLVLLSAPATVAAHDFDEPDAVTERCLAGGTLLAEGRQPLTGITAPELYRLECDGVERRVVVKRLHERKTGLTRFDDGSWEINFTDSFRYERAAYLLDRELGIGMVPVAVIREVDGRPCALIEFIGGARQERRSRHTPTEAERARLERDKDVMALFDALIYNTDRNWTNWLVDDEDWRLYLIDHSRSFRTRKELPESYQGAGVCLPKPLYDRLRGLETETLVRLLDELVDKTQIKAVAARRDKLIDRIEADRGRLGDEEVFCREP